MFQFFLGRKAIAQITANGDCVVASAVCEATAIKTAKVANGACVVAPAVCSGNASVGAGITANGDCVVASAAVLNGIAAVINLSDWSTHLRVIVENPSASEQTDYIVRLYLDGNVDSKVAALIAASQTSGTDLLVKWNGTTINFSRMIWNKSSNVARVFVQVPTLITPGDTYLDLYTGNPTATDLNDMHSIGALAISDFNSLEAPTRHQDSSDRVLGTSNLQLSSGKILRAYATDVSGGTDYIDSSINEGDSWTNVSTLPGSSSGELTLARIDLDSKVWLLYTQGTQVTVIESVDEGINWSPAHVIAGEKGGGGTLLYKSPTEIFAFFTNETTGVMECWKSTGAYDSWSYTGDVGTPDSRFEDPASIIRENTNKDLILLAEDEPGGPGDVSDSQIRGYLSRNNGVDWNELTPAVSDVIPPGNSEPGFLTYVTLNSGKRELRFYFSTSAFNNRGGQTDYSGTFIGYTVFNILENFEVSVEKFKTIKVTKGRNTSPVGGVAIKGVYLQSGEVLASWISYTTGINYVYQMKVSPDVEGSQDMFSFLEPLGILSGNTVDSNDGFCIESKRNAQSGRQYVKFPLYNEYSNLSVEVDIKSFENADGLILDLIEGGSDVMRNNMSSHIATSPYKPTEICYSPNTPGNYNSLDIVTNWVEQTWYNLRYDLVDGTTTLIQKAFVDEVEKSVGDNTGTRVVGIDEVRLNVDNWQASGIGYWNNFIVRELTNVGDVITRIDKEANGDCVVSSAVCDGTAQVIGKATANGDVTVAPATCAGFAAISGQLLAAGSVVVAPAVAEGSATLRKAIDANGDCTVAPSTALGSAIVIGKLTANGDCTVAPAVAEGILVKDANFANGDAIVAPTIAEGVAVKTAKVANGSATVAPTLCSGAAYLKSFLTADGDCTVAPAVCSGSVIIGEFSEYLNLCVYDRPEIILILRDEVDLSLSLENRGDIYELCEPELI